jgi:hypothetical protein
LSIIKQQNAAAGKSYDGNEQGRFGSDKFIGIWQDSCFYQL